MRPAPAASDAPVLDLRLERGRDGETRIAARRVVWPWSLPRGFRLGAPPGAPGCLTLMPQAAGAALLPGDAWDQRIALGPGAAARVISAGSTAAHGPGGATSRWRLTLGAGAWLALLPDPMVLFDGAAPEQTIEAELGPGAVLVLADGVCLRDRATRPLGWASTLSVSGPDGLVIEERQVAGADSFARLRRLPGAPAAFGSLTVVGAEPCAPGPLGLGRAYAAVGRLRGGAGVTARLAAPDGGALADALRRLAADWFPGFAPRP